MLSAFVVVFLAASARACPNQCSGHGDCGPSPLHPDNPTSKTHGELIGSDDVCTCHTGFFGGDCSQRICPKGRAWSDITWDTDEAHSLQECSNRGSCDRTTGTCLCFAGFEGIACSRLTCPNECSAHGQCQSIYHNAESKNEARATNQGPIP